MSDRVTIRPAGQAGEGIDFELVGDDEPTGGVGGWETLDRRRRAPAVFWGATPAITWTLPLLIDGVETSVGVDTVIEQDIARLERWGQSSRPKRDTIAPPVLQVLGPVHYPATTRWVLQDLSWGARLRNTNGRRIQAYVTVTLQQYVSAELVVSHAKKARGKGKKNGAKNSGGKK